jgi:hypothetical protein
MITRRCSNCFKTLPLRDFYLQKKSNRGSLIPKHYQSRCKSCNAEVCRGLYQRSDGRYAAVTRAYRRKKKLERGK